MFLIIRNNTFVCYGNNNFDFRSHEQQFCYIDKTHKHSSDESLWNSNDLCQETAVGIVAYDSSLAMNEQN